MFFKFMRFMMPFVISFNLFQFKENHGEDYKLLSSTSEGNIKLYAVDWKDEEIRQSGVYEKILLQINENKKEFSWKVDVGLAFAPELILSDVNNDNKDELIVITTKWTGTEVSIKEIHIFKVDNFEEIEVVEPLEEIKNKVHTELHEDSDPVIINISIGNSKFSTRLKKDSVGFWFEDVYFGNVINYSVANKRLIATVAAQVSPSLFFGEAVIEYIFEDGVLRTSSIRFNVYGR